MSEIENSLNDPESQEKRWNQEDPLVMYLVVNRTLEMSMGKTAAQVGHGVGLVYEYYHKLKMNENDFNRCDIAQGVEQKEELFLKTFEDWKNNSFRKVVLSANEKQFKKIKETLQCWVVVDAGFTEIPTGSETVLALAPMRKSEQPRILRKMMTL